MLDLQTLERTLAPLEAIGQDTLIFDAGGTEVVLRYMTPDEETEAQRWSSELLPRKKDKVDEKDDGDMDAFKVAEYLDRFKVAVISYSLIKVGTQDLGDHIGTGEKLDNGKDVKVPRHKALRQLLPKWGRPILTAMFRKYAELMDKVDQKANKAIRFDPSDLEAEIDRVEQRLASLQRDLTRRKGDIKDESGFTDKVKAASEYEAMQRDDVQRDLETIRDTRRSKAEEVPSVEVGPSIDTPTEVSVERRSIIPKTAAAPSVVQAPKDSPKVPSVGSSQDMDTSFIDAEDSESTAVAVAVENARLMASRNLQRSREVLVPDSAPAPVRRPPHADARDVALAMETEAAEDLGKIDGVPAFRMPSQVLETREQPRSPGGPVKMDDVGAESRNPRFRPPNQGV